MSTPYGQPPAPQQFGPTGHPAPSGTGGSPLGLILALVAGGLGLIVFFLSFPDDVGAYLRNLSGYLILAGGLAAAASLLPKAPKTLVPGAIAIVTGTLFLVLAVATGGVFPGGESTPALAVVALILAFLQSAAVIVAVLFEAGVVAMPKPNPYQSQQPWTGQQPGGYPGSYPGQQQPGGPPAQQQYPPQQATQHFGVPPGGYGQGAQPGSANPEFPPSGPFGAQPGYGSGQQQGPGQGQPGGYGQGS